MSAAPQLREDDLQFIRRFIQQRSAIVLDGNKDYLIEARLGALAEAMGYASLGALVGELRRQHPNRDLVTAVVEAMTTNETSFFRDIAPFDCLRSHILPDLLPSRLKSKRLDIWCGASSSGQEPYSVLLILQDLIPDFSSWQVQVLATDLSSRMVARTRSGSYSQLEVNRGLPAKMLVESFEQKGVLWHIKPELRRRVDARELNLIEAWPAVHADIVFLRNVLIYFDVPTKRQILNRMKRVLAPDGYLFLGGAETTLGIDDDYERVDFPNASCYRLSGGKRGPG